LTATIHHATQTLGHLTEFIRGEFAILVAIHATKALSSHLSSLASKLLDVDAAVGVLVHGLEALGVHELKESAESGRGLARSTDTFWRATLAGAIAGRPTFRAAIGSTGRAAFWATFAFWWTTETTAIRTATFRAATITHLGCHGLHFGLIGGAIAVAIQFAELFFDLGFASVEKLFFADLAVAIRVGFFDHLSEATTGAAITRWTIRFSAVLRSGSDESQQSGSTEGVKDEVFGFHDKCLV
jgi:hypothetical protein